MTWRRTKSPRPSPGRSVARRAGLLIAI